jgi:hypothetical protein
MYCIKFPSINLFLLLIYFCFEYKLLKSLYNSALTYEILLVKNFLRRSMHEPSLSLKNGSILYKSFSVSLAETEMSSKFYTIAQI